jgi:mRNA interferase RelE/StbE
MILPHRALPWRMVVERCQDSRVCRSCGVRKIEMVVFRPWAMMTCSSLKTSGEKIAKKLRDYVYPQLGDNPHFGKNINKLKNYQPETWRYKIGGYRFFYEVDEKEGVVYMLTVDARKDSYR